MKTLALVLFGLVVYILHQDFWNWDTYEPLVFGFIPVGLAYHAGYAVLCSTFMMLLVKYAWPYELEAVVEQKKPEA